MKITSKNQIDPMLELLTKKEFLHKDLADTLTKHANQMVWVCHPLVHTMLMPGMEAMLNAQYLARKKRVAECKASGEWNQFLFLHEKPYRVEVLLEHADDIPTKDYWSLAGSVWTNVENLWQYGSLIETLLFHEAHDLSERHTMMDPEEQAHLKTLPEQITIYRGCEKRNRRGWSWTTDKSRAEWFAMRFRDHTTKKSCVTEGPPLVLSGTADTEDVIAFFDGRNESEIVIHPNDIRDIKETKL